MDNTILSVSDAKKLLGIKYKNLTKEELIILINNLETLGSFAIISYLRSKNVNIS